MQSNKIEEFLKKTENKLRGLRRRVNIADSSSISTLIKNAETDEIVEMINDIQYDINSVIRYRAHLSVGSITDFERNNYIVSLSEKQAKYSSEIFAPFIEKHYIVTDLGKFEPFTGYNVYLLSWKIN